MALGVQANASTQREWFCVWNIGLTLFFQSNKQSGPYNVVVVLVLRPHTVVDPVGPGRLVDLVRRPR